MIHKTQIKYFLIAISLIFLAKLVYNIYNEFFIFPEEKLLEIQKYSKNYIILPYDQIQKWNQRITMNPTEIQKIFENSQLYEVFIYDNLKIENLNTISPLEFNPITYKIKISSNDPFSLFVYFYKKNLDFLIMIYLLYNSFLWTLFLAIMFISLIILMYFVLYLYFIIRKNLKEYFLKKVSYTN